MHIWFSFTHTGTQDGQAIFCIIIDKYLLVIAIDYDNKLFAIEQILTVP